MIVRFLEVEESSPLPVILQSFTFSSLCCKRSKFGGSADFEPLDKPILWLSEPSAERSSSWLSA